MAPLCSRGVKFRVKFSVENGSPILTSSAEQQLNDCGDDNKLPSKQIPITPAVGSKLTVRAADQQVLLTEPAQFAWCSFQMGLLIWLLGENSNRFKARSIQSPLAFAGELEGDAHKELTDFAARQVAYRFVWNTFIVSPLSQLPAAPFRSATTYNESLNLPACLSAYPAGQIHHGLTGPRAHPSAHRKTRPGSITSFVVTATCRRRLPPGGGLFPTLLPVWLLPKRNQNRQALALKRAIGGRVGSPPPVAGS